MSDDKTKRHPLDGKRIDINDSSEVRNWCNILNVTKDQLTACVRNAGTSSEAVRKCLGK